MSVPGSLAARVSAVFGKKFVRDTIVLQGGMVVTMAMYLVTSVLLARGLGVIDFGRYTIAYTLYTLVFFVVNLGVTTATISRFAQAAGRRDRPGQIEALAAYLKLFGIASAVILVVGIALPALAALVYGDRPLGSYAWLLCWLGPTQVLNGFVLIVQQGTRRMGDYVLYDNACGLMRLVFLVFALIGLYGLPGVVAASLAGGAVTSLIGLRTYALLRRDLGPDDAPPPLWDILRAVPGARVGFLFNSGTLIAVSKNGGELLRNLTILLIGRVCGNADVAHFRVAYYYTWAIQQLLGGLGRGVLPTLGFRHGRSQGDLGALRRDLWRVGIVSGFMFIGVTALFCVLAPLAVRVLYGAAYEESVLLIFLLALGHLVLGFSVVVDSFYIYTKQLGRGAAINGAIIVGILVPAGYVLVLNYGVRGGALFMALAQMTPLVHFVLMARYFRARPRGGGGGESVPVPEAGAAAP